MAAINRSTDMTTGSIWKRMVSFAVPVFLGNLCQQLYNTVDSVIVGKFVGKQALAAVASSGNLIFMMTGFFMGLFIGAGIVIAQYFGAKNYEKVRAAVHTDFAFALCCGVLLTLLGVFFTPTILTWMRTPADVLDTSILYFRLYFLGSLATILYNAGMGILQAVGDSRSPMKYLIIASITNVVLDLVFVAGMGRGVESAALDDVFELLAWNQGIGFFSSEIGPSALFQAYKLIKNGEKQGKSREDICSALREKFGEKNPEMQVLNR